MLSVYTFQVPVHSLVGRTPKKTKQTNCRLVFNFRSQFFHNRLLLSSQTNRLKVALPPNVAFASRRWSVRREKFGQTRRGVHATRSCCSLDDPNPLGHHRSCNRCWRHTFDRLPSMKNLLLVCALALGLAACAPSVPRFGNYGGPVVDSATPEPPDPKADICAVAQPSSICWYPAQARFHPDGQRLVVTLCSNRHGAAYFCRMVEYQIAEKRWRLIPGQEALPPTSKIAGKAAAKAGGQQNGQSYLYPAYSPDGQSLVFVVDDCEQAWCRGAEGFGQLATMGAQAEPGQDARYGEVKRLPVTGATRPNFTPDGKQVVYWRNRFGARLASGRSIGSVSVFAYAPTYDVEEHLVPSLYTQQASAFFIMPLSAPHFSADGKTLRFSAQMDNSMARGRTSLTHWMPDVEVNLVDGSFAGRATSRVKEGLGQVFAEHPRLGYLAGPGNLRLVDAKTLETKAVYLDPGEAHVNDADVNPQGTFAVAMSGILSMTSGAQSAEFSYWVTKTNPKDLRYTIPAAPVLALIDLSTNQVQALEWPNVEALTP